MNITCTPSQWCWRIFSGRVSLWTIPCLWISDNIFKIRSRSWSLNFSTSMGEPAIYVSSTKSAPRVYVRGCWCKRLLVSKTYTGNSECIPSIRMNRQYKGRGRCLVKMSATMSDVGTPSTLDISLNVKVSLVLSLSSFLFSLSDQSLTKICLVFSASVCGGRQQQSVIPPSQRQTAPCSKGSSPCRTHH